MGITTIAPSYRILGMFKGHVKVEVGMFEGQRDLSNHLFIHSFHSLDVKAEIQKESL